MSFPIKFEFTGFAYIGTSDGYDGRTTSVAWKSELETQSARKLLADTLIAEGWTVVPDHNGTRVRYQRGFIPHQPIVIGNNQQFCRDLDGSLSIQARQSSIGTVVTLSYSRNRAGRDCASMIAERLIQPDYTNGLLNFLPAISVETNISTFKIITYFEQQMTTQQWIMDTSFEGTASSGQIWQRQADDLKLMCIVTAITSGNGLRLRTHMESL